MYNTILLPLTLDQGQGARLMECAKKLKKRGGRIIAMHVIDQEPSFVDNSSADTNEMTTQKLAERAIEEQVGNESDTFTAVLTGHPGRTITDYADVVGADCIIVESHKADEKKSWLGSTAARIKRYAKCPVYVLN